jgi:hypothetical protein
VYAHYLGSLALEATSGLVSQPIPTTATSFRSAVVDAFGEVNYESILAFSWNLGIAVVPLADPGGFHAVVWRDAGRNCIVLKQQTRIPSRWAFDLLHELDHASEEPGELEYAVIDDDPSSSDKAEIRANQFAGDVLLDGRAEELAAAAVKAADGRLERLKSVVPGVAQRGAVEIADLANYLAFRLSLQGENWWGAATNLQGAGSDPWETARSQFLRHADLRALNSLDRGLLVQALTE